MMIFGFKDGYPARFCEISSVGIHNARIKG
jgi:hypothetical protein